jgi:chromosome partitioning protein
MTRKTSNARIPSAASPASPASPARSAGPTITAVVNFKGGAGKTTTAVTLACELAAVAGKRVLLVDLDAQANATTWLLKGQTFARTVGDWLLEDAGTPMPTETVRDDAAGEGPTLGHRLHLLPASIGLSDQEEVLGRRRNYQRLLAEKLAPYAGSYDVIILDCPPAIGPLTRMALCAATEYLVPCLPEKFHFDGLGKITQLAAGIQAKHNPALRLAGILFCRYNAGQKGQVAHGIVLATGHVYGEHQLLPFIRQDAAVGKAQTKGEPLHQYDHECNALADYSAVAEILYQH